MRLISWNIQWCCGVDGRVDPARIAAEVKRLGDADIICLQEVADNFASLAGSEGENQVEALARELPGRELAWGFAVDVTDGEAARRRFGNLIVSRLPLRRVLRHSLPWPADPSVPSMPRMAVEAAIEAPFGSLRVTNTHLEYYSAPQRAAQIERLRELHAEACAHARAPADLQAARARRGRGALLLRLRVRERRPRAAHQVDSRRCRNAGFRSSAGDRRIRRLGPQPSPPPRA